LHACPNSRSGGESLWFGYCSTQGWQQKMEDTLCVHTPMEEEDEETGLFAVFDGHQGALIGPA
jgi:serine/threonine protein phosphatase PrpC